MLPLFLLLLNHHHMIGVFNAIIDCFKHPMQLNHGLLHAIHMKVYYERLIAHRERLENHVSSQFILEFTTKLVQSLKIICHLYHMRTDLATLYQFTHKQGFRDIILLNPCLVLKHSTQPLNYSVNIHMLILFLQIRSHYGKHETAHVERIITSLLISYAIYST
jgi:hypothetical protein